VGVVPGARGHRATGRRWLGRTKWNRTQCCVSKTHILDAICIGEITGVAILAALKDQALVVTGRGTYARTKPGSSGFPRLRLGWDQDRPRIPHRRRAGPTSPPASMPAPTSAEWPCARPGRFNISTSTGNVQGVDHRHCTVVLRSESWGGRTNQKESSMPREVSATRQGSVVAILGALWGRVSVAGHFR